ncbi:lipocalin family protein [Thalassotalea mangrovi]|uniref:Outer membrane lipoprotein Blc n=1 Tax=Thalassotalea mangrovi TaxID=2572245 RepID=A0A4U1B208_9GAMM|nr:lipocalin family protein [Thalassotalea mangrovi]TKB43344.1 lipocalin [Thalassotalea mangrovi]
MVRLKLLAFSALLALSGCNSVPEGVQPVTDFELPRYLGTWYEVARLDHSFERGLEQVTANYSLAEDGTVVVVNRGYDQQDGEWQSAEGKAKFVSDKDIGHLQVSFFGPIYMSYVIAELQEHDEPSAQDSHDYQTSFVVGYSTDYVWLLSRTPEVSEQVRQQFIGFVESLDIDANQLIWVNHK